MVFCSLPMHSVGGNGYTGYPRSYTSRRRPLGSRLVPSTASPRPLSAASSFPNLDTSGYSQSGLAPPPIMPGSALRLLNQSRAQGLFTPSTSSLAPTRQSTYSSTSYQSGYAQSPSSGGVSPTPPPIQPNLPLQKRRPPPVTPQWVSIASMASKNLPPGADC